MLISQIDHLKLLQTKSSVSQTVKKPRYEHDGWWNKREKMCSTAHDNISVKVHIPHLTNMKLHMNFSYGVTGWC